MIRLMGEDSVDVPLWDEDGLMFATPDDFMQALGPLGLSSGLVADLVAWSRAWQTQSGEPDHDAEAARLVRRLRGQMRGVQVGYQP